MPELIDSYVCAYQGKLTLLLSSRPQGTSSRRSSAGDILLQGKMYITDRYLCFHSRIISYVTKHVHPWEQIERVTKERRGIHFSHGDRNQTEESGEETDLCIVSAA